MAIDESRDEEPLLAKEKSALIFGAYSPADMLTEVSGLHELFIKQYAHLHKWRPVIITFTNTLPVVLKIELQGELGCKFEALPSRIDPLTTSGIHTNLPVFSRSAVGFFTFVSESKDTKSQFRGFFGFDLTSLGDPEILVRFLTKNPEERSVVELKPYFEMVRRDALRVPSRWAECDDVALLAKITYGPKANLFASFVLIDILVFANPRTQAAPTPFR